MAQGFSVMGYAIALGGTLLDNARLFDQVHHLAVSDPLTGLANYRRLLDELESETERTNRSNRPFSVLLLDLDGLKKQNRKRPVAAIGADRKSTRLNSSHT